MAKNNRSLKWVFSVSSGAIFHVILLSLLGMAMSYLSVRFALVSKNVVDIATGSTVGNLRDWLFALVFLIAMQIIIHIIYTLSEVRVTCSLTNSVQKRVFSRLAKRDYMALNSYHSGELVSRLSVDTSNVAAGIISIVPIALTLCSKAFFSFKELFALDYQLALICLLAFPLVTLAARFYGKKMKPMHKECLRSDDTIKSFMQDTFQNILAVKAFVKEDLCTKRLALLHRTNYRLKVKRGIISIFANLVFFAVMTFAYYFALIWCAAKIHYGIMTVGTLTAILQLVGAIQEPFRSFSSVITGYYTMIASGERLIEIENLPPDASGSDIKGTSFEKIVFDNVTFSYGEENILSNVSFDIERGSVVSVSGTSGIGKSTFMKLAMGVLKPNDGSISIVSHGKTTPPELSRSLFAYVPQGNMILSGSVLDNITFFDAKPDIDRAKSAASLACLAQYIDTLPDSYDTLLGEGGLGLSEGQIQRLAIARAIYADRPVFLLDEATSSLDADTEETILSNIKSLGKTCVLITHRPCGSEMADANLTFGSNGISQAKKSDKIV